MRSARGRADAHSRSIANLVAWVPNHLSTRAETAQDLCFERISLPDLQAAQRRSSAEDLERAPPMRLHLGGKVTAMAARPRPRPRFALSSRSSPAELCVRVNARIKADPRLRGIALAQRIELAIDGDEHHFWSPQLVLQVQEAEDGGTLLEARFGPDPYVWALYLFSYGALLVLTFWALIFGVVQWTLGQPPTALWAAPALALLAALVYGASFVGQGLGAEQMYFLRATMADLCESAEPAAEARRG